MKFDLQYNLFLVMLVFGLIGFIAYTWLGALLGLIIGLLLHISSQLREIINLLTANDTESL